MRYELIVNATKLYPFTQEVKKKNLTFSDEVLCVGIQPINRRRSMVSFVLEEQIWKLSLSTWSRFEILLE